MYKKGIELSKNRGQLGKAIEYMEQAFVIDRSIAGGSGKYSREIKKKLATLLFFQGVDAYVRRAYPDAYKAFRKVLKYEPDNDRANKRLADLAKVAKDKYLEAYVIRGSNEESALQNLDIILKIVPPSNRHYKKAKLLKEKMQGPLGDE